MSKKGYFVIGIVSLLVGFGLMVGGWFLYEYITEKPAKKVASNATTQNNDLSPSSLSVGNANSDKTGQLLPDAEVKSGTKSAGSSNASNTDTASFAQYEKYKDGDAGLFGELTPGTGAELTVGKKATITYKGWLTSGQLFDQSATDKDGKLQAMEFVMGEHKIIVGMEQGLLGMKVGGKRLVIVPPAVGYGKAGQSPIPPNAVLIFEVTLHQVQ